MATGIALIEIVSMLVVNYRFQRDSDLKIMREISLAHRRVDEFQTLSLENLVTLTSFIAEDPRLRGSIVTGDRVTIQQALDELYGNYRRDLFWLLSPDGIVISRVENQGVWGDTLLNRAVINDAHNGFDSGDLWIDNGKLHQISAVPVRSGGLTIAILLLGEEFDAHLTKQFTQLAGLQLVFIGEDRIYSASEIGEKRQQLGTGLIQLKEASNLKTEDAPQIPSSETSRGKLFAPTLSLNVSGEPLGGAIFNLVDVSGNRLATGMIYRSLLPERRQLKRIQLGLLIVDIAAILLTFIAAYFISKRITGPIERLVAASARLGKGDMNTKIEPEANDEIGELASELDVMRTSLLKAQEDLIQSERLTTIGRMASSIIHDFRQPISVIYGYLDLLTMPGLDRDKVESYKDTVFKQFDRMLGMINELLEFARGEVHLKRVKINAQRFIADIVKEFEHQSKSMNIEITFESKWDGEFWIDAERIQRGIENILRNGLQVLKDAGTIKVALEFSDEMAHISIQDNGPGIPPEIQAKLFEPFVTFGKSQGTGLGLAVTKRVIVQHGGSVTVESPEGYGATFHIRIPVSEPEKVS